MALPLGTSIDTNEKWGRGTCDRCGRRNVTLHCICDDEQVCEDCLENDFCQCHECNQHWDSDFMEDRDGHLLCPDCAAKYDREHEEEECTCCDRCGKECDESDLEEYNCEMLCEDCLEKAKIDDLDPDGIWFSGGGWNRCEYEIQGDDACSSASFAEYDADEAFDLWTEHCVDLNEKLDEAFYFFMRKGTLRKGPVYCLFLEDIPSDLAEQLEITEEQAEAMADGNAPKGWVCVPAAKAQKFINFEFLGM